MRSFGSDNHSGIHPQILEAIANANVDHALAYGDDPFTKQAEAVLADVFGASHSFMVLNGTGANILALGCATDSFNSIIAAKTAHINVDECGAPEKFTGCKISTVQTPDGKLTPALVEPMLSDFGFQHHSQPKVISISQPTELGTVYTKEEIDALASLAHSKGMFLHIDGARLANAIVATGQNPRSMVECADIVSLGGTKNGMMIGEAILVLNDALQPNVVYRRKQAAQLASKMRFISAQFLAYLKDDLYLKMAGHSNQMAKYLEAQLTDIPQITITQKVETNAVFARLPREVSEKVSAEYFYYLWDEPQCEARWMASFNTTTAEIDSFVACIKANL